MFCARGSFLVLGREAPELKALHEVTLRFWENAGDCGQTPILVRFVELGSLNAGVVQSMAKLLETLLVTNAKVDVAGMSVRWTTVGVSVFKGGVAGLNCLLSEWEIAARDGV